MMRLVATGLLVLALTGCWQTNVGRTYYASGKVRTEATVKNGVLEIKLKKTAKESKGKILIE